jgi:hypothetical protein
VHRRETQPHPQRRGFGFRNLDALTAASYLCLGGVNLDLPTETWVVALVFAAVGSDNASMAADTSLLSYRSEGSILSLWSQGSILSIGSTGSVLSIGSAGSFGSVASIGSFLSVGSLLSALSIGSVLAWRARGRIADSRQARRFP